MMMCRFIVLALVGWFLSISVRADEATVPDPFELDLTEVELGAEPDGLFVVDGEFVAAEGAGGKVLELNAEPLAEGLVLLGDSLRGGGAIRARVEAAKRGRSYPRFGVGLHGISGYRLRVVPARKMLEIVADEEVVAEAAFAWNGEVATWLKLRVFSGGEGKWNVKGWAWSEGDEEPEEALLSVDFEKDRLSGKGVLSGTPYAGLPIYYDKVTIVAEEP